MRVNILINIDDDGQEASDLQKFQAIEAALVALLGGVREQITAEERSNAADSN